MRDLTTTGETVNRTAQNRPPTAHADTITAMQRDRDRYARKARSLEAAGRTDEAREAREIEDAIQQCEAEEARRRAKSADFSFVQPIMDGHEGESVLDN